MTITLLWITQSVVGLALSLDNLREALGDLRYARAQPGYTPQTIIAITAWAGVRRMAVGMIVMATFLAVGVVAVVAPGRGIGGWIIAGGLSFANITLVVDAIWRRLARAHLRQAALRERAAE